MLRTTSPRTPGGAGPARSPAVLLALGAFNHVIVATLELFFGLRYGGDVAWGGLGSNFVVAAAGNVVGGVLLVTLTRFSQARGSLSEDPAG